LNKLSLILNNCILGFYSGLPLLLLSSTLQAWYIKQGISLIAVGALSLVSLPYLLKFLWAPFIDYFSFKSKYKRKAWILFCQLMIAVGLIVIAMFEPKNSPSIMAAIALVIAFFSATLDIAVDAYKQVHTPFNMRATVVAGANIAYRLAMLLAGGLALIFADNIGWQSTYNIMAFIMVIGAIYSLFLDDSLPSSDTEIVKESLSQQITSSLAHVTRNKLMFKVVILFTLYKMADAFLLMFLQPFLLQGLHYSLSDVGLIVKIFGTSAVFLGAACAGVYARKISSRTAMLLVSVLQSLVMLLFVFCSLYPAKWFVIAAVFLESFVNGAAICVLVVFIMSLCTTRYAATQIAFFSAVAAVPRVMLGPICGYFATVLGWTDFFVLGFILSLPIILLLSKCNNKLFESTA
jgi:MFS transporter, PAT family, beta-lactamase induction signal transducer AmpG